MVDAVMVPSAGASYQEDTDTFLITLKNMRTSRCAKSAVQTEMAFPRGDLPLKECSVLAYITGFIVRKIRQVCGECRTKLQSNLDPHNPVHVFLSKKTYMVTS